MSDIGKRKILLTGATGYIGGRLLPRVEELGYSVRCLTRRENGVEARNEAGREIVVGNVLDPATLPAAMADIDTAFYFVHSMGNQGDFEDEDRQAAQNFSAAAKAAGVRRIIYLGSIVRRARWQRMPLTANLSRCHFFPRWAE
ncbi:MAG: NAD(P)H-binding protein [Pirellulaceae bacterium]